jgi:diguanylate cyclase (GGDEF)-like protein
MRSHRMGPTARTIILCVLGLASGLTMLIALVVTVRGTDSVARELSVRVVPAQTALRRTWSASSAGQELLMTYVQSNDPLARAKALAGAQSAGQAQNSAWAEYLRYASDRPGERALQRSYAASASRSVALAARLLGMAATDPAFAKTLADERGVAAQIAATLASLDTTVYAPAVARDTATIVQGINDARDVEYWSYAALGLMFGLVGLWLMQGARRDDRRMRIDAAAMKTEARYSNLETSLQRALEMELTEEATYDVIEQALTVVAPDVPSEMLLADSSQAHFRQVFSTAPAADAACRVGSPLECPATLSGQTQLFKDSSHLDTCPYLRGRSDRVWAACVPVSIAGRTTGVLHMQRALESPPGDGGRGWELIARKAGDRIGMLRAFARSETQARTDPLTGLLNRRSLEARTRDLADEGLPYVVAYGDLDHFKLLNDVHGHDTGDRALRLFARVLRDSVRPNDIPARYGGEEFVAVLPDCSIDNAVVVIERIRTRLDTALVGGAVPPFTVSFGLAPSEIGRTFSETVDAADQALLRAKSEGRDRIVIAGADAEVADPTGVADSQPNPTTSA